MAEGGHRFRGEAVNFFSLKKACKLLMDMYKRVYETPSAEVFDVSLEVAVAVSQDLSPTFSGMNQTEETW